MQTWGLTDPGNIRQQNQDSYAIVPFARDRVLMIVCDGMGGAKSGNVASSLAVEVFTGEVRRTQKAGMTPEKVERYSWPQALLAMGLLQAYEQTKDKTALSSVFSYLRRWKNSGYPIAHVDHVMNGSVALWTEGILTREKREDAESLEALWICREGADICAGWIKAAKKTADGILAYRSQHPDWLFADTLGMLCPFACRYGVQKQDKELLNLGIRSHKICKLFFYQAPCSAL